MPSRVPLKISPRSHSVVGVGDSVPDRAIIPRVNYLWKVRAMTVSLMKLSRILGARVVVVVVVVVESATAPAVALLVDHAVAYYSS